MLRLIGIIRQMGFLGMIKTVFINFRIFPFKQAVWLPIFLTSKVEIKHCYRGCCEIMGGSKRGVLKIGFMDKEYTYNKSSLINFKGKLVLIGNHHDFAPGTILYIGPDAVVTIGNNFTVSHDTKFYVRKSLTIGDDNMWSYYNVIMDNDGHKIYNSSSEVINPNKEIVFGNHVWMGCGCKILKGTNVADGNVIASASILNSHYAEQNCVITSNQKTIKHNIIWDRKLQ